MSNLGEICGFLSAYNISFFKNFSQVCYLPHILLNT